MAFRQWAMVITVQTANSVLIVRCIRSSVFKSTVAAASCRTITLIIRRRAVQHCTRISKLQCSLLDNSYIKPVKLPASNRPVGLNCYKYGNIIGSK